MSERVELTTDHGWVPGTRTVAPEERVLVLVHRAGLASVAAFSERADAGPHVMSAAQGVRDAIAAVLR